MSPTRKLNEMDQRENCRREQEKARIIKLPGDEQALAQAKERRIIDKYDRDRNQLLHTQLAPANRA